MILVVRWPRFVTRYVDVGVLLDSGTRYTDGIWRDSRTCHTALLCRKAQPRFEQVRKRQ
jgi:hypothetical protein